MAGAGRVIHIYRDVVSTSPNKVAQIVDAATLQYSESIRTVCGVTLL